jgi:glycosyltransferase involved in cell wall biosynthesis
MSSGYKWMNRRHDHLADYTAYSSDLTSTILDFLSLLLYRWQKIVRIWQQSPPSGILLVSWHPFNFLLIRLLKTLYPGTPVISWVHEPYKDEKRVYGAKALFIYLIELFQDLSLRVTDVAVLHSRRGLRFFHKRYPWFKGQTYFIPLQYKDGGPSLLTDRPYVSFLGRADQAKGIELFFDLVADTARLKKDWMYQIVTSSNIRSYLQKLSPNAQERLHVVNKPQLSDEEIWAGAANSLAVAALYKETMQSGIIPVAWMKGTPVIGTDIEGITEWIKAGITGVIVPANPTIDEIKAAIRYIKKHFQEMTTQCRADYLATFDDGTWQKEYGWILDLLPPQRGPALRL